ncbi:hypothetical protein [Pseudohaliea rubra]|uniref:Uncharacterized protein n=1 Tax=Pseudohaliea rubra DSM 19751 TaxID=1265313 RepID=A0A095VNU9_9GAMM|nr:hypothetical protein [Pseudohaliea rubra]KGE02793.1 hypothetical protein HRUBRA_02634 [Pseudohaliea rubra DSM 19751]
MSIQPARLCCLLIALAVTPTLAQRGRAPTCDDLVWSAAALAANPDVARLCQGVYVKGDTYYAKATMRVSQINGNRITFLPHYRDGGLGKARSVNVPTGWRVAIDGEELGVRDLVKGQELTVFLPQDRFAIAVGDGGPHPDRMLPLE